MSELCGCKHSDRVHFIHPETDEALACLIYDCWCPQFDENQENPNGEGAEDDL